MVSCLPRSPPFLQLATLLWLLLLPTDLAANSGPPVANDDPNAGITPEDTPVNTNDVLANDLPLDDATITDFDVLSLNGGSVTNNGDGTFGYTPASGFNGTDSFTYTLTDADGESDSATVFVTVTPVNNGVPVAGDDPLSAATTRGDTVITANVLANDTLTDHALISSFDANSSNGGTVLNNGDGTFSYTPPIDFSGLDSFDYTLSDDESETASATVTIVVSALPRGFVDVTLIPGVDPGGSADSTQGLQNAINLARDSGLVSFFPAGTYRVSDTLDMAQNTEFSGNPPSETAIKGQSCVLIGSTLGTRPRIVLQDGAPGFGDPLIPKAVLYYRLNYQVVNESQAGVPNTFENNGEVNQMGQGLRGLEIVTGDNPGAIGVHMAAAQESFLEDVRVDARGGLAGISGLPGRGMASVKVEIEGGRYGLRLLGGSLGASLVGVTLRNQLDNAIVWESAVGLSVTGFRIERNAATGSAITTSGGGYRNGNLILVHGSIEMAGGGPAVDNATGNFVYLNDVWVSGNVDVVQSAGNPVVPAVGGAWTQVKEYSYARTDAPRPHFNLIDGVLNQDELVSNVPSTGPPANLVSRHTWTKLPGFEDNGVFNVLNGGAVGDGTNDDTAALQQAIDTHQRVFVPDGTYLISQPLRLRANTWLFGVPGNNRTTLMRAPGWQPTTPAWMIETDDAPASTAYLGDLVLRQDDHPFLGGLHWRLGEGSMVNNVWPRKIRESEDVQAVRIDGAGGGRWYRLRYTAESKTPPPLSPGFRSLLIDGTTQPLYIYGFNSEHSDVQPYVEVRDAANVFMFGGKAESGDVSGFMTITDSRNIWISQLGRHSIKPGEATFVVSNSSDVQITGVWPNDDGSIPDARYSVLETDTGLFIHGERSVAVYRRGTINDLAIPASITVQPADSTVPLGQTATFSIVATGEEPLVYQWQKNGSDIPGATGASYATPPTTAADDGARFSVVVSNLVSSQAGVPATLTIAFPVTIEDDPGDQTVSHLEPATFTVGASGFPPLTYQWQRNGVDIPGATAASYTLPQTIADDTNSSFRVVVSNSLGSATSAAATLTITVPPDTAPILVSQPASQNVTEGEPVSFAVVATGSLPLAYQWQRNGAAIPGATAATYSLPAVTLLHSGAHYRVLVSNAAGITISDSVTLNVDPLISPRVTSGLQALYTFGEGGGTLVGDSSGVGSALDLTIANPAAVTWLPGRLDVHTPTTIVSAGAADKLVAASRASNALSVEAWLQPANTTQDGPARIVTLSQDTAQRNFTLGQEASAYDMRLRTTSTNSNGNPSLSSPPGTLTSALTHVTYTRDATGDARLYVDGIEQSSTLVDGDLSVWNVGVPLALANEPSGERPWLGEFDLVAIYDRALTPAEVAQNHAAGPVVNNAPVAVPDLFSASESSSSNVLDVLANDSDADPGTVLVITGVDPPDNGGSVVIGAGPDALLYTPQPGFNGTENFTYTISDGASTSSAAVTVSVTPVSDGTPLAADDPAAATTAENTPVTTLNVLANDTLVDHAAISAFDNPSANGGAVTYNGNGTFAYTPAIYFHGSDSFTYTLSDDEMETSTATVTVTVTPVNNGPPLAVDDPDAAATVQNQAVITLDVTANDVLVDNATVGAFDSSSVNGGSVAYNGNGTFTYTPATDFTGDDSFTYTLNDEDGENSAPATISVTVTDPATGLDGDLAPRGAIDGQLNAADLLIMQRIVTQQIIPTPLELVHGDMNDDGEINLPDLILLQQAILQGPSPP